MSPYGISGVLERLRTADPSAPRLIWYGPESERVELSGRVLDNWVAKTANLLDEELDAGASTTVELAMPTHWKTVVWALACWQVGATVALPGTGVLRTSTAERSPAAQSPAGVSGTGKSADIVVASDDGVGQRALAGCGPNTVAVLVAMGALAMRWPAEVPAGAVDYAAEVRSYGDVYQGTPAGDAEMLLHVAGGAAAVGSPRVPDGRTGSTAPAAGAVVLPAADAPLVEVLEWAMACWAAGGTLVLVHPGVEVTDRLLAGERVTVRPASG